MGFFKKIFKGIGKVFKGIGKVVKGAFKGLGKLVNKAGIFGQIGLMVLSMYAGPILFSKLSALASPLTSAVGKGLGTVGKFASGVAKSSKIGRVLLQGAKKIADAALGAKKLTLDSLGSIAQGTKNMITSTVKAAGEKIGLRATGQAVTATQAATTGSGTIAAQAGSDAALTSISYNPTASTAAVTESAGGGGYFNSVVNELGNVKDSVVQNFWDAGDIVRGTDPTTFANTSSVLGEPVTRSLTADPSSIATTSDPTMTAGFKPPVDLYTPETSLLQPKPTTRGAAILQDAGYSSNVQAGFPIESPYSSNVQAGFPIERGPSFTADPNQFDLADFAKQKPFTLDKPIGSATIQQGSLPSLDFFREQGFKEDMKDIGGQVTGQQIAAGVISAGQPVQDAVLGGARRQAVAQTGRIAEELFPITGGGIPSFGDMQPYMDTSNLIAEHSLAGNNWQERGYNDFLNQNFMNNQSDQFTFGSLAA